MQQKIPKGFSTGFQALSKLAEKRKLTSFAFWPVIFLGTFYWKPFSGMQQGGFR